MPVNLKIKRVKDSKNSSKKYIESTSIYRLAVSDQSDLVRSRFDFGSVLNLGTKTR